MSSRRKTDHRGDEPIRVLVCNRYELFRDGIRALLEKSARMEVVGEAANPKQAIALIRQLQPDVVLMDVMTRGAGGSAAIRRIKHINPNVKVLILSLADDESAVSVCLQAGAAGYIRKDGSPWKLRGAISTACRKRVRAA